MSKVYVFIADGCEEIEALTPVDLLRRAGVDVCTVSITDIRRVTGSHDMTFETDAVFTETDFSDGDMFVLPGGMPGTKNLAAYPPLIELLRVKCGEKKRIAAICAAPAVVLGQNGFLRDKKAVCYPGMEEQMEGAIVLDASVVTDGSITTSRGMGTAIAFSLELISLLQGENAALEMKEKIVYGHRKGN